MKYDFRCNYCGHFVSWEGHDEYTPFGSCEDLEPPDPVILCGPCADIEKDKLIKSGRIYRGHWIPAMFEYEAAKIIGWGRAGPMGASWSEWFPNDKILPDGYEWHWFHEKEREELHLKLTSRSFKIYD